MVFLKAILAYIPCLIIAVLSAGFLLWLRRDKQRAAASDKLDAAKRERFIRQAADWMFGALPAIITKAENAWFAQGAKTGAIKLSEVKAELLKIVPSELIALYDKIDLDALIEAALCDAKDLWEETPDLLVKNLVKDDTEDGIPEAAEHFISTCKKRGVLARVVFDSVGEPEEDDAVIPSAGGEASILASEPVDVGLHHDDPCPVGHRWEPDGNGGFVAVLDAPDAAPKPKPRRKRREAAVEPANAGEGETSRASEAAQGAPVEATSAE